MNDLLRDGRSRERDLVLPPNSFVYILNKQKGEVDVHCGPYKANLDDNTDQPVLFSYDTKRFEPTHLSAAIQNNMVAPEGWYLVLKNPATGNAHPAEGTTSSKMAMDVGKKINIAGPANFALYPGQMCRLIEGHHMRSNQYLIVRVYDEILANNLDPMAERDPEKEIMPIGKLMIIKGTERSFYIPPNGFEVVRDEHGQYVRDAVTLERLEYCVLLDENGNKTYVKGPDVVFPEPTQQFVTKNGSRKFKARNLNNISGIYIQVLKEYTDEETGETYKPGDELFITGDTTKIYYPREEHAIVKYDNQEIHYAVAIPAGEGRYLLNRTTGEVETEKGPKMLLADPRTHVSVRRILADSEVNTWFPGNHEAMEWNRSLRDASADENSDYITERTLMKSMSREATAYAAASTASRSLVGDVISKSNKFTKPRTITLDTKYEGAVRVSVWRGFAILVESKSDKSKNRVVVGPDNVVLDYDETLVTMQLSTGKPKNTDRKFETPYLRYLNNTVSDIITGETKDTVDVSVKLVYKVDFTGEPENWFNVENYVKHLCDRIRSMFRKLAKSKGVEEFSADYVNIVRDMVLGESGGEDGRKGYLFPENGMKITDVEVLNIAIGDDEIAYQLRQAQTSTIEQTLLTAQKRRELEATKEAESIQQQIDDIKSKTKIKKLEIRKSEIDHETEVNLSATSAEHELDIKRMELKQQLEEAENALNEAEIERRRLKNEEALDHTTKMSKVRIDEAKALADADIEKFKSFTPQLIAALQAYGDKNLIAEVSKNFNVKSMIGAQSVVEAAQLVLRGTGLEEKFEDMLNRRNMG